LELTTELGLNSFDKRTPFDAFSLDRALLLRKKLSLCFSPFSHMNLPTATLFSKRIELNLLIEAICLSDNNLAFLSDFVQPTNIK